MSAAEPTAWTPPPQVDEFVVEQPLGQGGMGQVYLARDTHLDRPVALKFISGPADLARRGRFLIEARAIARLMHPNVAAIYRVGDVLGQPYIAYEFVEGLSLDHLPMPQPWWRVLDIALGLSRGLAAAHQCGIVHRDIKPGNVMWTRAGTVKLIDFGLAKLNWTPSEQPARISGSFRGAHHDPDQTRELAPQARGAAELGAARPALGEQTTIEETPISSDWLLDPSPDLTKPGSLLGTPSYASPEAWTGVDGGPRSDVYSFGLVLHRLCTGKDPRASHDDHGSIWGIAARDPAPLREVAPEVPELMAEIVDRCLQRDPELRFASAVELAREWESVDRILRMVRRNQSTRPPDAQHSLVCASFERIEARATALSASFYARLFERYPALRPLFPADMTDQQLKLVGALQLAIENLDRPERLTPLLEDLGRRHVAYSVRPDDFELVGACLLETLAEYDAVQWNSQLEAAWASAYGQISGAMQRGLVAGRPPSSPPG